MKIFNINLDIKKSFHQTDIVCVQNDNNTNVFNIDLYDGMVLYGISNDYSVEVAILKADGTFVVVDGVVAESTVSVTLTAQALAFAGQAKAEVRILQGENVMTSTQFLFLIRENIVNDGAIESTTEYRSLEALITQAAALSVSLAEASASLGNVDALQQQLAGIKSEILDAQTQINSSIELSSTKITELEAAINNANTALANWAAKQGDITALNNLVAQATSLNTALANLTETINSANSVDGNIKNKVQVIEGWIANPDQFKGEKGEPATVTNTSVDGQGNTTVTFNDGTIVTVQKGADGTMTFADLTQEQKDSLKGDQGERGERGDPASNLVTSVNGQIGEVIVTDTTYSAGTNVTITGTTISATDTIYDDTELETRVTAVENREDKDTTYTAGTNVTINENNVISATDTTYGLASASANGLMSSAMWTKLNGLYNMVYLTESAFTALGTKDPNTLYLRY